MTNSSVSEINRNYLCVLQRKEGTQFVEVDYRPIPNVLQSEFESVENLARYRLSDCTKIIDFVDSHPTLKRIFTYTKYCRFLQGSHQQSNKFQDRGFSGKFSHDDYLRRIRDKNGFVIQQYEISSKEMLLQELRERLLAHRLDEGYRQCQQDKTILVYSHCILGWTNKFYQISPDFAAQIFTNFGYGSSSYFLVKLNYKGVDIVPFQAFFEYEDSVESVTVTRDDNTKFAEFIPFSSKFQIDNQRWKELLEYIQEAHNLSITNEQAFIEKYIINNCEILVSNLENMLVNQEFRFVGEKGEYYNVLMEGRKLIEYRSKKISGALSFLDGIQKLGEMKIAPTQVFAERIIDCNRKILELIVQEIPIIDNELNEQEEVLIGCHKNLQILDKQWDKLIQVLRQEYPLVIERIKKNANEQKRLYPGLPETIDSIERRFGLRSIDMLTQYIPSFQEHELFSEFDVLTLKIQDLKVSISAISTQKSILVGSKNELQKYQRIIQNRLSSC